MIGNKIKSLRNKRAVTQEHLAEYLGITAQAISRWESGTCYPDIELLPAIADYFSVTVDDLLCIDKSKKKEKIEGFIKSADTSQRAGNFDEAVNILRLALKEFPSSFLLQAELACALGCIDNGQKISKDLCEEVIILCSHILDDCLEDTLRLRAKAILCYVYAKHLEELEKAKQIADSLPPLYQCREVAMAETLKLSPLSPEGRQNVKSAIGHLLMMLGSPLSYQVENSLDDCVNALITGLQDFIVNND
jgi:transcriptional regulator with XRE-family HTH domain